ncbi:MAG: nucleotide exchange factor GrpE [Desulfobacteraceae bacterium 4572_35.1]|nr:MAG: nucleotide exchange factor GrpE [Desulfobacteraceae bacterium 4572_35.1]
MTNKKNPEQKKQQEDIEGAENNVVVDNDDVEVTAEQRLKGELDDALEEVEKHKDLYLRTRAETDNFRRRMQREKEELSKFANESLLREVLPVADNLQRAVAHAREAGGNDSTLLDGVEMTLGQFNGVLEKFNVTPVEADGKPFDPACHEAMGQLESDDCDPNTVVQVLQTGYMLNGRLLRPALVMVSKTPAANVADANVTDANATDK